MIKRLFVFLIFSTSLISAQVDYSDSWEDFFSYNNVKDFIKSENIMYALSDNAIFTYDFTTQEINKLSSVQGLSGETTSAIHYSTQSDRLVIGYKNGLALGLGISALGTLLFYPAANTGSFNLMLSGLFIVALGFSLQQTVANPLAIAFIE